MKKLIAIISVLAAVLSFASCSVKNDKTAAEIISEQDAEYSRIAESLSQAEIERSEKVVKNIDDLGKTEKNKQLVVKVAYPNGEHYQVFIMNRKGICQKVRDYYFYETAEMFEIGNEKQKEDTDRKKIESDKEARMLAFESDYDLEERNTFDQLYELYKNEDSKIQGYEVIE